MEYIQVHHLKISIWPSETWKSTISRKKKHISKNIYFFNCELKNLKWSGKNMLHRQFLAVLGAKNSKYINENNWVRKSSFHGNWTLLAILVGLISLSYKVFLDVMTSRKLAHWFFEFTRQIIFRHNVQSIGFGTLIVVLTLLFIKP